MAIEEKELYLRRGLRPKIEPCLNMLEYYYFYFHRGKGAQEPKAQRAGSYPCFKTMKHLGVLLLPPGHNAIPSQGYPPAVCCPYPFIHLGEERQIKWSKVPCLRKQCDRDA